MTTAARVQRSGGARFYSRDGQAQYEVIGSSTGRPRPVTIADARKNGWFPSVTTVLKVLAAPALTDWLCEQAALAVLTSPRKEGEELDAFVRRVLQEERVQDEEAAKARDLGTAIHKGIEDMLNMRPCMEELKVYVAPAIAEIHNAGRIIETEKVIVGDGYAGRFDALTEGNTIRVWDIKTSKNLPKYGSYPEHKAQLGAYSVALGNTGDKRIETANLYVSTTEPGKVLVDVHDDWPETYERGFRPLLAVWQWLNDYRV
jgi:hypothetical protein